MRAMANMSLKMQRMESRIGERFDGFREHVDKHLGALEGDLDGFHEHVDECIGALDGHLDLIMARLPPPAED